LKANVISEPIDFELMLLRRLIDLKAVIPMTPCLLYKGLHDVNAVIDVAGFIHNKPRAIDPMWKSNSAIPCLAHIGIRRPRYIGHYVGIWSVDSTAGELILRTHERGH